MAVEPSPVTAQPTTTTSTQPSITTQPSSTQPPKAPDQISYADSDEHARQYYCGLMRCCEACCADGDDQRWYYPWDKGPFPLLPPGVRVVFDWSGVPLLYLHPSLQEHHLHGAGRSVGRHVFRSLHLWNSTHRHRPSQK